MNKKEIICDCEIIHKNIVLMVKDKMLDEDTLMSMSDFFKILSDPTRIKIINALDCSEMCVCDIAALLNMTKSRVSHQLKKLRELHLVKYRKEGKEVFYSLKDEHVKDVFEISLVHVKE